MEYHVFNIILSSNIPLEELTPVTAQTPDVVFQLRPAQPQNGTPAWFHEWVIGDEVTPWLCLGRADEDYLLRFPDLADFIVSPAGDRAECFPVPGAPPETIRHLLLDQVMPLMLAQRGGCVVHASAVVGPDGQAVAFAAASGSGKSTLAAHLARQGWLLLTDDGLLVTETEGQVLVTPGYPGVRLWEDSRDALFGPATQTQSYAHYTSKKRLALAAQGVPFGHWSVPLGRLYFLAAPDEAGDAIEISPLTPREAFMELVKHTFQLDIHDTAQLKINFARFSHLVSAPLFYRLNFPRAWKRLPEVSAILSDQAQAG